MLKDKFKYYFLLLLLTILKSNSVHASDDISDSSSEISENEAHTEYGDSLPPEELRIVHGNEVPEAMLLPYIAHVHNPVRRSTCGGTLISKCYVLTAAHCCEPANISRYRVYYNTTHLFQGTISGITTMIKHPESLALGLNLVPIVDICILRLATPANIDTFSTLHTPNEPFQAYLVQPGTKAEVFGFGITTPLEPGESSANLPLSPQLRSAIVPIISNEACSEYHSENTITDGMLCAGFDGSDLGPGRGRYGICHGDSGGPLYSMYLDTYIQIGVASLVSGCGKSYDVYTRISKYRNWIWSITTHCEIYIRNNPGATGCPLIPGATVIPSPALGGDIISSTSALLSTSLILMITAFVPFTLF